MRIVKGNGIMRNPPEMSISMRLERSSEVLILISTRSISYFVNLGGGGLNRIETSFPQNGVDYDLMYRPLITGVDLI